jgi:hypothetical protein
MTLFEPIRSADFSPCGQYRYRLQRIWDESKPAVAFIGLNPSTANGVKDDPTMRRVISFAKREGFGSVSMFNLFNVIGSKPKIILTHPDPLGPDWIQWYQKCQAHEVIIFCWGAFKQIASHGRASFMITSTPPGRAYCLGKTNEGHPCHPLFLPSNTPLIKF